ncbi:MAG: HRDC domain-containing protein [Arcanobacterium sp.]|nr:HRDC domain-containing protein [Arcanobacterium sp.]
MINENIEAQLLEVPKCGIPNVINSDIDAALAKLSQLSGPFAVDTERAMGIRYSARAYLIQIKASDSPEIFLIDPVGIENRMSELNNILQGTWILHAASQDLPCLAELGLFPNAVFDTEMAARILGFAHVSLQALVAELLGVTLAKEHSAADWSQRPINSAMRAYAALDVELLHDLKLKLEILLKDAGREEWFWQECEAIRTQEPPPKKTQPWRKASRRAGIRDQRSLAMLAELWAIRDFLAKERDISPSSVISSQILAELALRKPRSFSDVRRSALLRSRILQRDVGYWWQAIEKAWKTPIQKLPARIFREPYEVTFFPPMNRWESQNPEAFFRWEKLRAKIITTADELGIKQEILLKPALQKRLAWEGWESPQDFTQKLHEWGARDWQISELEKLISAL